MRLRLGTLAAVAGLLAAVCGGCKFTGVSAVYMAIDSAGAQPRTVFYTDSTAVYCVALVSSGKADVTVDFTIEQIKGPNDAVPTHKVFSVGEETPGVSTESAVSFLIPPNGIDIQVTCLGYCFQNGVGCPTGYQNQGADSCGVGATCCYDPLAQASSAPSVIPYPVGTYQCTVEIDGAAVGEPTQFSVQYPPPSDLGESCPVAPPVTGLICADWVPPGAKCTGFNSYQTCTCKGASWDCENGT